MGWSRCRRKANVEPALLHANHKVWDQTVAETVSLLHYPIKLAGFRLKCHRRRIARSGSKGGLVFPVGIEALDRRLHLWLNPDIAGRAHTNKQRAGFRIDRKMPVGVALHDPEHATARDQLLADRG